MLKNKITVKKLEKWLSDRKPMPIGEYDFFSVLVPMVEKNGELHIFYEVRADHLSRQPGEVSFPGGAVERGETEEMCAVRETSEELGIPVENIRILGQMDTLFTYSNATIYAFLGALRLEDIRKEKMNRNEVKDYFLVPLSYFLKTEPFIYKMRIVPEIGEDFPYERVRFEKGYNWRKGRAEVPIYNYKDQVVWGLTARITKSTVDRIKEKMEP